MLSVLMLIIFFPWFLLTAEVTGNQVLNYLILNDSRSACREGKQLVVTNPNSEKHWEVYIQALAANGESALAVQAWDELIRRFPDQSENRALLESMAWGVIQKGSQARSPIIRSYALIGAFFGQDARGVEIICHGLSDSHIATKSLAVKLCGYFRDDRLKRAVLHVLGNERNLQVRLEAISAVGRMKMQEAKHLLFKILESSSSRSEEKCAAIQALVSIFDQLSLTQVKDLVQSNRAALRELGCRVVQHLEMKEAASLLVPLLDDASVDVKCAALETFGFLKLDDSESMVLKFKSLSQHSHPRVAITASWVLCFIQPDTGFDLLEKQLYSGRLDDRLLAASALSSTGEFGRKFWSSFSLTGTDPYLQSNLALGSIANGMNVESACATLVDHFVTSRDQWMWKNQGLFRYLAPSDVKHVTWESNYPEIVNQLTRLEVLNILAIKESPDAVDAAKHFLSRRQWGISGMASALLLQEGDENAIAVVKSLIDDSEPRVRVQAALILAIWGRDERSVQDLQNSYQGAGRELKERILEGLGSVGSKHSIPFLVQKLREPQPTLGMIAAAALLQCLYH